MLVLANTKKNEKEAVNAMNKVFSEFLDKKISLTAEVKVERLLSLTSQTES
jgi:hypothetical protein